jgi:hypothetical protein
MSPHRREVGFGVDLLGISHLPAAGRMASFAGTSGTSAMDVAVTRRACRLYLCEVLDVVAQQAIRNGMGAFESKSGVLVVKVDVAKRGCHVTGFARAIETFMRTLPFLLRGNRRHEQSRCGSNDQRSKR